MTNHSSSNHESSSGSISPESLPDRGEDLTVIKEPTGAESVAVDDLEQLADFSYEELDDRFGDKLQCSRAARYMILKDAQSEPQLAANLMQFCHLFENSRSGTAVENVDYSIKVIDQLHPCNLIVEYLPEAWTSEFVDTALEIEHIDGLLDRIDLLNDAISPEQLQKIIDKALETGLIGKVLDNIYHIYTTISPEQFQAIIYQALKDDLAEKLFNKLPYLKDILASQHFQVIIYHVLKDGLTDELRDDLPHLADITSLEQLQAIIDKALQTDQIEELLKDFYYLKDRISSDQLQAITNKALQTGQIEEWLCQIPYLAYWLPSACLDQIIKAAIESEELDIEMDDLHSLKEYLSLHQLVAILDKTAATDPAEIVDIYCQDSWPNPVGKAIIQLTDCMKRDPRTKLAPAYLRKIIDRLPQAEGKPYFDILFDQAMTAYRQIELILNKGDEAQAMLEQIQKISGNGSKAEFDSINKLNIIALDPDFDYANIKTAEDIHSYLLTDLNRRLGLNLDISPNGYNHLTEKMGDILPTLIYAQYPNDLVWARLAEIVASLNDGSYNSCKYPERTELINDRILPPISEATYKRWQRSETTSSAEAVIGMAQDISAKVREIVKANLSDHPLLEQFNHLPDSKAKINTIKASLAEVGQQISAIHQDIKTGKIDRPEAKTQLIALENQKQQLELARDAIRLGEVTAEEIVAGKIYNENGRETQALIKETIEKLAAGHSSNDLLSLKKILDNYQAENSADVGHIITSDVDDYQTTIEIGANPVGSCQHYQNGVFRDCLLSNFDPNVKTIIVRNQRGRPIGRAILRLASDDKGQPVMVLEETYTHQAGDDIDRAIRQHAQTKAEGMGLKLYSLPSSHQEGPIRTITLSALKAPYGYSDLFEESYTAEEDIMPKCRLQQFSRQM